MSANLAIRVTGLGKQFLIGHRQVDRNRTLRDLLTDSITRPFRRADNSVDRRSDKAIFWALRDVTFEVKQGETLGIIGRNGAGKSTLLKVLSRITAPTTGHIEAYGRVTSLLEVGTGFHAELTGRENVFLNGAILGMKGTEIQRKFDAIVAFAEIEPFIDTPVKHYSSGMQVRLAFAVAAHLDPEILIVDEVLAVGDAAFQRKCLGRMDDVARRGRTVLFVSHNMTAVKDLCRRVIWLEKGRIETDGAADHTVTQYLSRSFNTTTVRSWTDTTTAPGNEAFRLHEAAVRPESGSPDDPITVRTPFIIEFKYWNLRPDTYLNVNLLLYNEEDVCVLSAGPIHEPIWRPLPAGLHRDACHVPGDLLNSGLYRVVLHAVTQQGVLLHTETDVLSFHVHDTADFRAGWYGEWVGVIRPVLDWQREVVKVASP
jgi:lipopolysaccharide transport system ATP-binding protein